MLPIEKISLRLSDPRRRDWAKAIIYRRYGHLPRNVARKYRYRQGIIDYESSANYYFVLAVERLCHQEHPNPIGYIIRHISGGINNDIRAEQRQKQSVMNKEQLDHLFINKKVDLASTFMIEELGCSPRQLQILELLLAGHTREEIRLKLELPPSTVRTEISKIRAIYLRKNK